jgi:chaperonin GroES
MKINIKAMFDRVVVKPDIQDDMSDGGIVILAYAKERPVTGEVLAVGTGRLIKNGTQLHPLSVKVGDKVLFNKNAGAKIKHEGQDIIIMKEDDVIGVFDDS